jgi:hypothetical protein
MIESNAQTMQEWVDEYLRKFNDFVKIRSKVDSLMTVNILLGIHDKIDDEESKRLIRLHIEECFNS